MTVWIFQSITLLDAFTTSKASMYKIILEIPHPLTASNAKGANLVSAYLAEKVLGPLAAPAAPRTIIKHYKTKC